MREKFLLFVTIVAFNLHRFSDNSHLRRDNSVEYAFLLHSDKWDSTEFLPIICTRSRLFALVLS